MGPLNGMPETDSAARGGDHGGDVGINFGVERQGVDHDLDFVEEAFGEQRADRAIDQAAGQGLELGWDGLHA